MAYNNSRNPLRGLQDRIGEKVVVRLKDGTQFLGDLKKYDSFMNLILTNPEKINRGQDEDFSEPMLEDAKEIFIRGNNVLFILPESNL